jgi:hypothetical protein
VNDEELIARARQLAEDGVRSAEAQALARELLRQLADRLDAHAAAQPTAFTHFPPQSGMDDRSAEDNGIIG